MSLATDVACAAAERVERTAGAGPGLVVWRGLASNAAGAELRGRAILGGVRCAEAVRDANALRDLALLWRTVDEGVWEEVYPRCRSLHRAGLTAAAFQLATAEVERLRTARALYMLARLWDVTGDPRAAAAFAEAIERGEKEGAAALVHACRVRRAAWLSMSAATLNEAIEEAKRVTVANATPRERLVLARVLLRSPSRFARAGALGILDDLVAPSPTLDDVARRALAVAAQHADDLADELTPLELDRLIALFSRDVVTKQTEAVRGAVRAIEMLARAKGRSDDAELDAALASAARVDPELAALHARARDILGGRFEPTSMRIPGLGEGRHPVWTALLDVVAALRDENFPRAAHAVTILAEAAERNARMPPATFTVAQTALQVPNREALRAAAGRLVAALLKTTSAPPRGYLGLSQTLMLANMPELAALARRAAASGKEPGANEAPHAAPAGLEERMRRLESICLHLASA